MAKGKKRTEEEALAFIRPIIPLLEQGMSMLEACDYAALARPTVLGYINKFESVDTEIKTAKMKLIATSSSTLSKAVKDDPKMALEVLRRRSKDRWSDKTEVNQNNTGNITIEVVEYK